MYILQRLVEIGKLRFAWPPRKLREVTSAPRERAQPFTVEPR